MIAAYHGSLAAVYASLLLDVWTRDNCSSCCSVLLSTSRCLFLFEIIISGGSWRPMSTKPSTFVHGTVHFSLELIPTSQHLLCSSEPSLVPQQLRITSGVSASRTAMRFLITSRSCHMLRVTHQALLVHLFR